MIPINNASKYHRTVAVYTATVLWCFLVGIFLPHVLREIINWARGNWFWSVDSTTATAMTNQLSDWLNEERWSCCTCGTLFGAIFGVVCQMTTWNFHFCGSDEWIFKWKPFAPSNRKYIFRLFHTTWPTWNNRKTHYQRKSFICTAVVASDTSQRGNFAFLLSRPRARQRNVLKSLLLGQTIQISFNQIS